MTIDQRTESSPAAAAPGTYSLATQTWGAAACSTTVPHSTGLRRMLVVLDFGGPTTDIVLTQFVLNGGAQAVPSLHIHLPGDDWPDRFPQLFAVVSDLAMHRTRANLGAGVTDTVKAMLDELGFADATDSQA